MVTTDPNRRGYRRSCAAHSSAQNSPYFSQVVLRRRTGFSVLLKKNNTRKIENIIAAKFLRASCSEGPFISRTGYSREQVSSRETRMSTANAPNRDHVPLPVLKSSHLHAAHVVQFYEDDSFYLDALNSSVKSLLEAGDAAIIIATEPHRNGLMARWKASGLDIARAMEDGRCILLDATETLSQFMQDGLPDPTAFADVVGPCILRAGRTAEDGHGRVFAFGEMVAVLCAEGNYDAAVALEELWNRLAETHAFTLHCAYPMKDFNRAEHGEYFLRICAEHSDIIPNESLPPIASERDGILTAAYLQQTARALQTEMMERREAEKLLRRSEGELAGLLENAPEGVYQTGL